MMDAPRAGPGDQSPEQLRSSDMHVFLKQWPIQAGTNVVIFGGASAPK